MAEITLKFDARNPIAKKTIDYILSLGVFKEVTESTTGLGKAKTEKPRYNAETEKAIQDVRNGKIFKVKNSKQLFKELGI